MLNYLFENLAHSSHRGTIGLTANTLVTKNERVSKMVSLSTCTATQASRGLASVGIVLRNHQPEA